jgi:hypothetical protein
MPICASLVPHDHEIDTQTFYAQAQVYSVSAVAEHLLIDRKAMRKFMRQTDFCSPVPGHSPGLQTGSL